MILDEMILTSQHQESYQRKLAKNEVTKKHDRKEETFCSWNFFTDLQQEAWQEINLSVLQDPQSAISGWGFACKL